MYLVDGRAVGYLLKDRVADVDGFVAAVRQVASGGTALDPEVVAGLVSGAGREQPLERLTPGEREVLPRHPTTTAGCSPCSPGWTARAEHDEPARARPRAAQLSLKIASRRSRLV